MSSKLRIPVAPDLSNEQRQGDPFGGFIKRSTDKLLAENNPDPVLDDLGQLDLYVHHLLHPYIGRGKWASISSSSGHLESLEYAFQTVRSCLKQVVRSAWIDQHMKKKDADVLQLMKSVAKGRLELEDVLKAEPSQPTDATGLLHLVAKLSYRTAADIILEDLHQPYIGDGVELLLSHIKWARKERESDPTYSRVVPFLQSSGSGKTRTVLELCKRQIGVYTCVRQPEKRDSNELHISAPAGDASVLGMLVPKPYSDMNPGKVIHELATWLKAMAQTLYDLCLELIEKAANEGTQDTFNLPREVDKRLNNFERSEESGISTREAFFAAIEQLTLKYREPDVSNHAWSTIPRSDAQDTPSRWSADSMVIWAQFMQGSFDRLDAVLAGWQADPRIEWQGLGSWIGEAAELSEAKHTSDGFMFLAIDHASSLGHRRLELLKQLLGCLEAKNFWVLLLDTDLALGSLADREQDRKCLGGVGTPIDAYVSTPYHVFIASQTHSDYDLVWNGTKHIDYRQLTSYMRMMGRPLWNCSHLNLTVDKFDSFVADRNLTRIYAKLTGLVLPRNTVTQRRNLAVAHKEEPMLGALAQRVRLDRGGYGNWLRCWLPIKPNLSALVSDPKGSRQSDFIDNQVSSHLRTVESVSWNFVTSVPSEPLIRDGGRAIKDFEIHVQAGILAFDMSGVQSVQILLNLAMDMALKQRHRLESNGIPDHLMPINALVYLRKLFGLKVHLSTSTEIWAKEHWINFTHFVKRHDEVYTADTPIDNLGYMDAFMYQGAILANGNQPKWDILIPAYRSKAFGPDTRVDPRAFDAIIIEVRAGQKETPSQQEWNADYDRVVEKASTSSRDLNIFVNLSAEIAEFKNPEDMDNGCLAIYVGGHGAEQYPALTTLDKRARSSVAKLMKRLYPFLRHCDARTQALHNGTAYFEGARLYTEDKRPKEQK